MQNPGKNYRKLTSSLDDYKTAQNGRLDADSSEINTYSSQSHNGAADLSSALEHIDLEYILRITDEPESEWVEPSLDTASMLLSMPNPPQAQEPFSLYSQLDFVQNGPWVANSSQDYSSVLSMEDVQPSVNLIDHNVYPSPTLSSPWAPYSSLSSTISPAPVPSFSPNHVSFVPTHGTPCADQMYAIWPSVTIAQNHSSAEVVQRSPVSLCPPTKPRSTSAERKTPSRPKKPSGSIHRCHKCPKTFSRPYNLSSHIKTHDGVKPHTCNYEGCTSAFLRPYDLARHERNHSGETPFVCRCGAQFKRHEGLKRHEKSCS